MFLCCCNKKRNQSADFIKYDSYLGYRKTKTMKHTYVRIETILV